MTALDYEILACNRLQFAHPENLKPHELYHPVGHFKIGDNEEAINVILDKRISFIRNHMNKAHGLLSNSEIDNTAKEHDLLTYQEYIGTLSNIESIRKQGIALDTDIKRHEAKATNTRKIFRPIPDRSWMDKQYYSVTYPKWHNERVRMEKSIEDEHLKVMATSESYHRNYSFPVRSFALQYKKDVHTNDRDGYLNYVWNKSPRLMALLERNIQVLLPEADRLRHSYITGGSGSGKSELIKQLVHSYVKQPDYGAVVVVDPHGDLVSQIAHWQEFEDSDRLAYIDPYLMPHMMPTINPLSLPKGATAQTKEVMAQQIVEVFAQLLKGGAGSDLTINMRTLIMPCLLILLNTKNPSLADLQRFMDDERNSDLVALGRQSKRPRIREFFEGEKSGFMSPNLSRTKQSVSTKLQSLFNVAVFDDLVNGKTSFDLETAINDKKIILFNLSKGRIGDEASEAFGRFIIGSLQSMALRRQDIPAEQRVPVHIFIDECQNYISPATVGILEETRKYGVHLTLAQQVAGRGMSPEIRSVVLNNTNVKFAGRTPEDARMAKIMNVDPEEVKNLEAGEFFCKTGNSPTVKIQGATNLLDDNNSMAAKAWQETIDRQKSHYRNIEDDIEPDIAPDTSTERELI